MYLFKVKNYCQKGIILIYFVLFFFFVFFIFRLKRDTQLNPADMLALVALVEAGERARKESDVENTQAVPMIASDADLDYVPAGSWMDVPVQAQPPLVDYYGLDNQNQNQVMPKYEYVPRQHKYNGVNSRKLGTIL